MEAEGAGVAAEAFQGLSLDLDLGPWFAIAIDDEAVVIVGVGWEVFGEGDEEFLSFLFDGEVGEGELRKHGEPFPDEL